VLNAVQAYAKKNGPPAAKAVLQQFGASAVKDIKPEQYAAAIEAFAV